LAFAEMELEFLCAEDAARVLRLAMQQDPNASGEEIRDMLVDSLKPFTRYTTQVLKDPDGVMAGFIVYEAGLQVSNVKAAWVDSRYREDVKDLFRDIRQARQVKVVEGSPAAKTLEEFGKFPIVLEERSFLIPDESFRRQVPRTPYEKLDLSGLRRPTSGETICEIATATLAFPVRRLAGWMVAAPATGLALAGGVKFAIDLSRTRRGDEVLSRSLDEFKDREELRQAVADVATGFRTRMDKSDYFELIYGAPFKPAEHRRNELLDRAVSRDGSSAGALQSKLDVQDARELDLFIADMILKYGAEKRAEGYQLKTVSDMVLVFPGTKF